MASSMWVAIAVIAVVAIVVAITGRTGRTVVAIIKAANSGGKFKFRMKDLEDQVHDLETDLQDARHRV